MLDCLKFLSFISLENNDYTCQTFSVPYHCDINRSTRSINVLEIYSLRSFHCLLL